MRDSICSDLQKQALDRLRLAFLAGHAKYGNQLPHIVGLRGWGFDPVGDFFSGLLPEQVSNEAPDDVSHDWRQARKMLKARLGVAWLRGNRHTGFYRIIVADCRSDAAQSRLLSLLREAGSLLPTEMKDELAAKRNPTQDELFYCPDRFSPETLWLEFMLGNSRELYWYIEGDPQYDDEELNGSCLLNDPFEESARAIERLIDGTHPASNGDGPEDLNAAKRPCQDGEATDSPNSVEPHDRMTINERMNEIIKMTPESENWSVRKWAEALNCSGSTVHGTAMWQALAAKHQESKFAQAMRYSGATVRPRSRASARARKRKS